MKNDFDIQFHPSYLLDTGGGSGSNYLNFSDSKDFSYALAQTFYRIEKS